MSVLICANAASETLDMLSRLKGMETRENHWRVHDVRESLDMLSRLKGMETGVFATEYYPQVDFRYAFPVEGNGNGGLCCAAVRI